MQPTLWFALFAPAQTPRPSVERLQREFVAAIRSPQVHETLVAQGLQPQTSTSAEFARYLHAQIAKWTEVARKANLKPE